MKRKAEDSEQDEDARRRNTVRVPRKLEGVEKQHTASEIVEVEVTEQEVEMEEVDHRAEDEEEVDPVVLEKRERPVKLIYMVETLKMLEVGSCQEATTRAGKVPNQGKAGATREKIKMDTSFFCNPGGAVRVSILLYRWRRRRFCSHSSLELVALQHWSTCWNHSVNVEYTPD